MPTGNDHAVKSAAFLGFVKIVMAFTIINSTNHLPKQKVPSNPSNFLE